MTSPRSTTSPLRVRLAGATMAALALTAAVAGGATAQTGGSSAPTPAGVSPSTWAWVVARHPSSAAYTPAVVDRGNSNGGTNTVTRGAVGSYTVILNGINNDHGVFQVTALAASARLCIIGGWGDTPVEVSVFCYTRSGDPANSAFSLSYLLVHGGAGASAEAALLWADSETTHSYTPETYYNFDSYHPGVAYSHIVRHGDGDYTVTMPHLGSNGGDVQVAAYSATVACRVVSWGAAGSDMKVRVRCLDIAGAPVDSEFDYTFVNGIGLSGYHGHSNTYLLAGRPTASSYHPQARYTFSTAGQAPTIKHTSRGHYSVILPGMPKGGAVQVTSYGSGTIRCNLSSIRTSGLPQTVGVRCYDVAGHAQDGRFTLAYLH